MYVKSLKKPVNTIISLLLILTLAWGISIPAAAENSTTSAGTTLNNITLVDIQGHWAEPVIQDWFNNGLTKGYEDGTFKPDSSITRAEFITMVNHAFSFTATSPATFIDVSAGDWFAPEIAIAQAAAYISGYQDGGIHPREAISRQEAASILSRAGKLETPAETAVLNKFKDSGEIPGWSKAAISAVTNKNIMQGYPDGTFQAAQNISRAEAITILNNVIETVIPDKTGTIYDKAGVYGPATGLEVVEGNITISAADITLQNMKITGNLTLGDGIENGSAVLQKVTVLGKTTIKGGGAHSITLKDCSLPSIIINKAGVRVVASGNTQINNVQLESGASLVHSSLSGSGFASIKVGELVPEGANVALTGSFKNIDLAASKVNLALSSGTITKLEISPAAAGGKVDLAADAVITQLNLNAAVAVTGKGTVYLAKISVSGASFEQKPDTIEKPDNVSVNIGTTSTAGGTGSGTGTGSGGGNNPLSFVSSDPADGSTGISNTPTIRVNFDRGVVRDYWDNNRNCFSLSDSSGNLVGITVFRASNYQDDSEKRSIYVTPNVTLKAGMTYSLTVSPSLKANNGNTLGASKTISFTVTGSSADDSSGGGSSESGSDEPAPSIGTLSIGDGDGQAALNATAPDGPQDGSHNDQDVLTFKLTANAVENILIPIGNNINLSLSNITGLTTTDLTNIELFTDPNGDGNPSDGAVIAQGTLGEITDGNAVLTFNMIAPQTISAGSNMNYIVQLDTSTNWGNGDTFTFAANSISITASGATSQQTANIEGAVTPRDFVNPAPSIPAPVFVSSEVTTKGDMSITFDKNMADPSGKEAQFTVLVDDAENIVSEVSLTNTPTKIKLVLTNKVLDSGHTITVAYSKCVDASGQITSSDGGILESFAPQTVTN
ncbi:MAG: S-layer homology domain-containing protein [Syntrophomonas sp.]